MYLTAGQYKGRKIEVPQNVKPTLSKVRQGVFNMLNQFNFIEPFFLDMFAGSGLMGLEAISRGYKVKELEINKKNAQIIKKNYQSIGLKADLIITNALNFKTDEKFDIIYLDPPWNNDYIPIIKKAQELKNDNGIIVIEYDDTKNIDLSDIIKTNNYKLEILKEKKYGRCKVALLQ